MPQWWLFSRKFSVARKTNQLKIPYYVKENFHSEYQGSVGRLEASVEEEYLNNLKHSCYRERNYSKCAILLLKFVCYICSSVLQMIILLVRIAFRYFYISFFNFPSSSLIVQRKLCLWRHVTLAIEICTTKPSTSIRPRAISCTACTTTSPEAVVVVDRC